MQIWVCTMRVCVCVILYRSVAKGRRCLLSRPDREAGLVKAQAQPACYTPIVGKKPPDSLSRSPSRPFHLLRRRISCFCLHPFACPSQDLTNSITNSSMTCCVQWYNGTMAALHARRKLNAMGQIALLLSIAIHLLGGCLHQSCTEPKSLSW